MRIRCGFVGKANVGKSTLFNALTQAGIPAENYPFCTIEPNTGIVEVPDLRLGELAKIVCPERILAATVEFVDIAGLIAGAAQGEGLGNKFLAHIRETHAIIHIVRCFEDPNIVHVDGKVDPLSDIQTIETELALADLATIEKALQREQKNARAGNKEVQQQVLLLEKIQKALNQAIQIRTLNLSKEEQQLLAPLCLLTAKPTLYVANITEQGFKNNQHLTSVQRYAQQQNTPVIAICAATEAALADLSDEEKTLFLEEMGVQKPGLNRLICAAFQLLGLHTYFTAGVKEVRAWTIPIGATAPLAAGEIHSDMQQGFIRAQTIAYADFIRYKGEQGAKDAGKMRAEGKDYIVHDGDIMHFLFNV